VITQQRLMALTNYDPGTGVFTNLVKRRGAWQIGARLGSICHAKEKGSNFYRVLRIEGEIYYEHRLAVLYMTGSFPETHLDVDHKNNIRSDNRWDNLRVGTRSQNRANAPLRSSNTSGAKNVHWRPDAKKWRAALRHQNRNIHIGYFATKEEAILAANTKAVELYGEFARV
jgi:hypothetical protein